MPKETNRERRADRRQIHLITDTKPTIRETGRHVTKLFWTAFGGICSDPRVYGTTGHIRRGEKERERTIDEIEREEIDIEPCNCCRVEEGEGGGNRC